MTQVLEDAMDMNELVTAIIRPVPNVSEHDPRYEELYDRVYESDVTPDSLWFEFAEMIEGSDFEGRVFDSLWDGNWLSVEARRGYVLELRDRFEVAWRKYSDVAAISKVEIAWNDWTSNDDREEEMERHKSAFREYYNDWSLKFGVSWSGEVVRHWEVSQVLDLVGWSDEFERVEVFALTSTGLVVWLEDVDRENLETSVHMAVEHFEDVDGEVLDYTTKERMVR